MTAMNRKALWQGALTGALLLPGIVLAGNLPDTPTVVAGKVTIATPAPDTMVIGQSTKYGIVNWGSFSIGQGAGVQFNNGSGATLNRVTGTGASSLLGSLSATGSVYLVNPNGIVIGRSGVVNTGGSFVASTLDLSNSNFLNGGDATFAGSSTASVVNLGKVSSMGGDVALIARTVDNQGAISAPQGTVGLVAGTQVLMRDASVDSGMFSVLVGSPDSSATTSGAIRAAAAELRANGGNVYALAGNTTNTIAATGVAHVNGRVFLTSGKTGKTTVKSSVTAKNADGTGGHITATGGTVDVSGTLDASGSSGGGTVTLKGVDEATLTGQILATGGAGGFAEVSGSHVTLQGNVNTGGGTFLIDPGNIVIANGTTAGGLTNATLMSPTFVSQSLITNDMIITAAGSSTDAGTILVQDPIIWNSSHSLTLMAQGDLLITGSIINYDTAGGGNINLVAGWDGSTPFNAATFNAANLATTGIFGNKTGVSYDHTYIDGNGAQATETLRTSGWVNLFASAFNGVSVGSRSGATRVYANGLTLQSPYSNYQSYDAHAQLGYNINTDLNHGLLSPQTNGYIYTGPDISGGITVRAKSYVHVFAGSSQNAYAQIGHVGIYQNDITPSVAVTGNITIDAGGNVWLFGGDGTTASNPTPGSNGQYAMIGSGSLIDGTQGNRSGAITVTAGGGISLLSQGAADYPTNGVFIGNTTTGGTMSGADMTLSAASFDQCDTTSCPLNTLDIGMLGQDIKGGNVRVTLTGGNDLTLSGSTATLPTGNTLFAATAAVSSPLSAAGNLIVQTSSGGSIILDPSFDYVNNDPASALILASGRDILNNAGANAISGFAGNYAFYSDGPPWDTGLLGVITPQLLNFGVTYDPANPLAGANGYNSAFVYQSVPRLTVNNTTTVYGTKISPTTTFQANDAATGTGFVTADPAAWGLSIGPAYLDTYIAPLNSAGFVNIGSYPNALNGNYSSASTVMGVAFTSGNLTVIPDTGTVTPQQRSSPALTSTVQPPLDTRGLGNFPTTPLGQSVAGATSLQTINKETTKRIVDKIAMATAFCHKAVGPEYAVDCLSERLQAVADLISPVGEYSTVRAALQSAAKKLHALAAQNASSVLGKRVASYAGTTLSRPLLPVSSHALKSVNAKAASIIAGTQLVLLRSSTSSDRRRAAYQQVSAILNTTLVLLRSS